MDKRILITGILAVLLVQVALFAFRSEKPRLGLPVSSEVDRAQSPVGIAQLSARPPAVAEQTVSPAPAGSLPVAQRPLAPVLAPSLSAPATVLSAARQAASRTPVSATAGAPAVPFSRDPGASVMMAGAPPSLPVVSAPSSAGGNPVADAAVWELPDGFRAPAAFLPSSDNLSPAAAAANEQISQDFEQAVDNSGTASPDGSTQISENDWNNAQSRADEQYRALFGDAAYNQRSMAAALQSFPGSP